jgi:hypothetical protein
MGGFTYNGPLRLKPNLTPATTELNPSYCKITSPLPCERCLALKVKPDIHHVAVAGLSFPCILLSSMLPASTRPSTKDPDPAWAHSALAFKEIRVAKDGKEDVVKEQE